MLMNYYMRLAPLSPVLRIKNQELQLSMGQWKCLDAASNAGLILSPRKICRRKEEYEEYESGYSCL
jgi:hypothetical protein